MAVAYVRDMGSNSESAFGTTRSDSFASLPTVGNYVFVGITHYRGTNDYTPSRVYDNQNHFYQEDVSSELAAAESSCSIHSTKVTTSSGTFTVSWNPTNDDTGNYASWSAVEFSGVASSNMPTFIGAIPGAITTVTTANTGSISRTVTAGSVWVVIMFQTLNGARSYTIAGGGLTWSNTIGATTLSIEGSVNNHEVNIWYAYDSAGGSRTATITVGGGLNSSFIITDVEMSGIDTSTPGDVAATVAESGTNTSHVTTGINTSSNCGLGIVACGSESGNLNDCEPSNGWNKVLGGDNTNIYYLQLQRTNGALTSETGEFSHATARQANMITAFFKAASAATPWFDKRGTGSSTTGDALATASGANSTSGGLALAIMSQLSIDTDINVSDTPPSGYSQISFEENSSATIGASFVYKIYSASETSSAQFTHDNTSQSGWTAAIATYRDTVGGGGGRTTRNTRPHPLGYQAGHPRKVGGLMWRERLPA